MYFKKLQRTQRLQGGFSLIELLVTSAIIGLVTAIVVIRYGAFNSTVLLRNQAYEVAFAAREAQVLSISVRGSGSEFRQEYGLFIDLSSGPAQELILYLDTDSSGSNPQYDAGTDEIVQRIILDSRFEVYDICLGDTSSLNCDITDLSVAFVRPDFDAVFHATPLPSSREVATIGLRAITDTSVVRTVRLNATGLISVE